MRDKVQIARSKEGSVGWAAATDRNLNDGVLLWTGLGPGPDWIAPNAAFGRLA